MAAHGWLRDQWHMHFFGKTPEALVQGRERIYLEHFWNDFAADPEQVDPGGGSQDLRCRVCASESRPRRHGVVSRAR